MIEAEELIDAIETVLPGLEPQFVTRLEQNAGYAFEAFCFTAIGEQLRSVRKWVWHHPGPYAVFSERRGGSVPASIDDFSSILNSTGTRRLCQSVDVSGDSSRAHAVDLVLLREGVHKSPLPHSDVGSTFEFKNTGAATYVDTARSVVGLDRELVTRCRCYLARQRLASVWLVSASPISGNAMALLDFYGIRSVSVATAAVDTEWAKNAAHALRWYRDRCPNC